MELHAAAAHPSHASATRARDRHGAPRRLRRVLIAASLIALLPALVSYAATALEPSNTALGIRSVEWLRDNGAASVVTEVESIYYTLTAPAKGGPALRALPRVGLGSSASAAGAGGRAIAIVDRPRRIAPLAHPALPGEGVWSTTQPGESRSDPPLLVTTFRSDPGEYPRLVAGVAWINTSRTTTALYPGRLEPGHASRARPHGGAAELRRRLLATFNSGFKLADSRGGWALYGHTYSPMRAGEATFVRYADGRLT